MQPRLLALVVIGLWFAGHESLSAQPAVHNGAFDVVTPDGVPEGWTAAGRPGCKQRLRAFDDPDRGRVAMLECTAFEPGFPDSHAMIAQSGRVGVRKGRDYAIRFLARAAGMRGRAVRVGLSNTRVWANVGLLATFLPDRGWRQFEFRFRATDDLAPQASRLQIWFGQTGTLWIDDITLREVEAQRPQRFPQISFDGATNAIPNSSFECGGVGWGCWTPEPLTWGAYPFRLYGEEDRTRAHHGKSSWRLSLGGGDSPVVRWDYYDPIDAPLRALMVGHEGWIVVEHGRPYVLSVWVAADRPGMSVALCVQEADGPRHRKSFPVGTKWQRLELAVTAQSDFAACSIGLDLGEGDASRATLWIDAVQLEAGSRATPYAPRAPVESFLATETPGNLFADGGGVVRTVVRAWNDTATGATVRGEVQVTDYLDRELAAAALPVELAVPAGSGASCALAARPGKGFFRLRFAPTVGASQALRCAVIDPVPGSDSVFGMNHAFGFPFLLDLAHASGLRWWRDWSVKWQTVQPEAGASFDFRVPDVQIDRCIAAGGQVLVLLPFPSARWASSPDRTVMEKVAAGRRWVLDRLPMSFKPDDLDGWRRYVRESVRHYWPRVRVFEILNEPLYTHYALPAQAGYSIDDYLELLAAAFEEAKAVAPECQVVAGISGGPEARYLTELIEKGGLRWLDILNYHRYPGPGWPEQEEDAFRSRRQQLASAGFTGEIWMTELGIYADDDPPLSPYVAGDATMNNAMRATELAGAADLVRWSAMLRAHGVTKVFWHAGTSAALHDSSAGNMFFRYGGAPRKQLAAIAVFARLVGPDSELVGKWHKPGWLVAYEVRSRGRDVVIAWTREDEPRTLALPKGYRALDLMGNALPGDEVEVGDIPIYLVRG